MAESDNEQLNRLRRELMARTYKVPRKCMNCDHVGHTEHPFGHEAPARERCPNCGTDYFRRHSLLEG